MLLPQRLDSAVAFDIAKAMMDGFNRHYRLLRDSAHGQRLWAVCAF
jgi:isocitrate dehydrogenase kinase/phosphatase